MTIGGKTPDALRCSAYQVVGYCGTALCMYE